MQKIQLTANHLRLVFLAKGVLTSQVVVWDFWTINSTEIPSFKSWNVFVVCWVEYLSISIKTSTHKQVFNYVWIYIYVYMYTKYMWVVYTEILSEYLARNRVLSTKLTRIFPSNI